VFGGNSIATTCAAPLLCLTHASDTVSQARSYRAAELLPRRRDGMLMAGEILRISLRDAAAEQDPWRRDPARSGNAPSHRPLRRRGTSMSSRSSSRKRASWEYFVEASSSRHEHRSLAAHDTRLLRQKGEHLIRRIPPDMIGCWNVRTWLCWCNPLCVGTEKSPQCRMASGRHSRRSFTSDARNTDGRRRGGPSVWLGLASFGGARFATRGQNDPAVRHIHGAGTWGWPSARHTARPIRKCARRI